MLISISDKLSEIIIQVNKNPLKVFQSLNFIIFILNSIQINIRNKFSVENHGNKYCLFMALFSISIWLWI
jgi:hypothetical protein